MKLYYTNRSPYASKVRAVANVHKISLELIELTDLTNKPVGLLSANPLGKIPALVLDDGSSVFDSPVICQYLDWVGKGKKLIPQSGVERFRILKIEAAADGVMDACVAIFMEGMRPESIRLESAVQKNLATINRVLGYFNDNINELEGELNLGMIAIASALGYINLRFSDIIAWEKSYPQLKSWYGKILKQDCILQTMPQTSPA